MTWPRASKSGVYRRALRAVSFIPALVFAASWFPVFVPDFDVLGSLVLHQADQLSSPVQKRVMRLVNATIVLGFSWPRCLASHSS